MMAELDGTGGVVIDLSTDFRIRDKMGKQWQKTRLPRAGGGSGVMV